MKLDAHITRRSLVAATATLLLAGCGAGEPAGSVATGSAQDAPAATAVAWTAELDPEAPFMNVAGEEDSVTPGDCWMQHEDGVVQVQVGDSSLPEPAVESAEFADGVLTVTMAEPDPDSPVTMDLVLHQFMVSAEDAPEVTSVVLIRDGESSELPAGELAVLEDAE